MQQLQKMFSRLFYRSPLFWIIVLLGSYTLCGFIILPKVVKNKLIEQVEVNLGWQASIADVQFNPYTFVLDINNLSIQDDQNKEVVSFAQYHLDFAMRSLVEGAFTFTEMKVVAPALHLVFDKNGNSNFQQALQTQSARLEKGSDNAAEQSSDRTLVKLLLDNIAVVDGQVDIVDHSPQNTIEHNISPLNFTLKNFSTYSNDGSYQLEMVLGKGQTIKWTGNIGVAPLHSSGSIDIAGIRAHKLWDYVARQSPYNLLHGLAEIKANYRFDMTNGSPEFELFDSSVQLQQLQVALKQHPQSFVDIKSVKLGSLAYNLSQQALQIKALEISDIDLHIERNKQGQFTFLAPFIAQSEPVEEASGQNSTTGSNDNGFKWSIEKITVSNSRVNVVDKVPDTQAQVAINNINFNLSGLNQDLTDALPFDLAYQINDSQNNTFKGQITPLPLNLTAAVSLNKIDLTPLQPYLNEVAKINLEQGKLSLTGTISLLPDEQGGTRGNFQGAVDIEDFNTKDKIGKQRLIGWQQLSINPIKVDFNPLSIVIGKINLREPYSRLIVTKDRSLNLSQLMQVQQSNTTPQQKTDADAAATDKENAEPLDLTIGEIEFVNGNAYFADLSLQPEFATRIKNINGTISGLSMNDLERADVKITGSVDDYGRMSVDGKINPLSGDLYTDINVKFEKIELATLTPYSGRYAGYVINKGKLNLDLNYKIAQRKLKGSNRLILEQFELGDRVDSAEAINLPIKLAVALFKDHNGIIDLSLPTQGDMDSPDFAIGGLVLKAFLNVMTKAVTSPFAMLANLAGDDDPQLNKVAFDFGQSSLNAQQLNNLTTLGDVLINRPQLILEIQASVDKEKDGFALKQKKLTEQLKAHDGDNAKQEKRIATMETLLNTLSGGDSVEQIKAALPEGSADKYEKRLEAALLEIQPLSNLELTQLAKQRVSIIQEALIEKSKVPENQVFVIRASLDGQAQENKIFTTFSLNTN